ncbi:unnamed protein product [Rotaria sp. Silwood1]|nr:unnamed protein product [Rotaria sp. Silwood1]CAF3518159.1 unnamed protein product [Rotaria sp. Silwood1]CAF3522315.1 unnamed protein product [Rotaria sp. Silwood1]CAF3531295.1 unnamed protein product [Rotaria sp. Silwood1]CAF4790325.1 unnamed protein product [Rotaria sp. Silwood1]
MVDTVTTTMGNDNDDWEVAVDTGEFDKRLEQQEQDRAVKQESISSTINNDDNRNSSNNNLMNSNKPIRILKRPTSQIQLPVTNDIINSNTTSTTIVSNNTNNNNNNSPFSNNISSSTTVPTITIIPRNQNKDSINSSQTINSSNSLSSQSTKPPIKTYEQRELEYRLARLRIMGEEESSIKDDDDINNNNPTSDSTTITSDEPTKTTLPSTTSLTSTKTSVSSLQSHSTPGSYASNLYNLNNTSSNTGLIHFNPNTNSTGPFSQQQYRGAYSPVYPQMPLASSVRYPTATFYMPPSSSPNYPIQSSLNSWYHYQQQQQQQQNPYGTTQYGHPQ